MTYQEALEFMNIKEDELSSEILKSQYRKLAAMHHPDVGGSETMFKKLQECKDHLEKIIESGLTPAQYPFVNRVVSELIEIWLSVGANDLDVAKTGLRNNYNNIINNQASQSRNAFNRIKNLQKLIKVSKAPSAIKSAIEDQIKATEEYIETLTKGMEDFTTMLSILKVIEKLPKEQIAMIS